MKKEKKKSSWTILVLMILLVIALVYIAYTQYSSYIQKRNTTIMQSYQQSYQEGTQDGYEFAIRQLVQQSLSCNPVPVFADNISVNLIAVECLQQQAMEESE